MYKLFKDTGETYTLPNGKVKTYDDLKNDDEYFGLGQKDCVVDISDGVLRSYQLLSEFAEVYGIEHTTGVDDPEVTLAKSLEARNIRDSTLTNLNTTRAASRVAQIMAMSFTDEQALEVKDIYPEYQVDHAYKQGDFFTHEGELYKVNQAHTSASQWEPGSVGTESLYTHLTLNEDGYPIWKQPTGAHDAYNKGDIVEYNGELYKSLIDGNAYSPDAYPAGWEKYTEPAE